MPRDKDIQEEVPFWTKHTIIISWLIMLPNFDFNYGMVIFLYFSSFFCFEGMRDLWPTTHGLYFW